ncbi:MAG: hypothetical protein AAF436_15535 [Myxococcota bacterium]
MAPRPKQPSRWFGLRSSLSLLAAAALAAIWCLGLGRVPNSRAPRSLAHPDLFQTEPRCSRGGDPALAAARAEASGRARASRYPYDPADGVLAVHQLRLAAHCHELAGRAAAAAQLRVEASSLSARVEVDYAAARLALLRAIEARDWRAVIRETLHVQKLTSTLGRNDYIEWLDQTSGKARAELRRAK